MATAESRSIAVGIDCPYGRAYDFLADPENFPRWASGLGKSLTRTGAVWIAETPEGPMEVRFTPRNEFGVLDHVVQPKPDVEITIPMRVLPNGDGCEVVLTNEMTSGYEELVEGSREGWAGILESLARTLGEAFDAKRVH